MSANFEVLATEVGRVVNSPYPTQLKTLHGIVLKCTENEISLWARFYKCQITTLAQSLVDALAHWPYVSDIVTRMSCAIPMRDAILRAELYLLDHVVTKAAELQPGSKKYLDMSVALLSHPLPNGITLPASTQTLLIKLFERAAFQPEVLTLKPILGLLHGACRQLVGILPFSVLSSLEDRLMNIMRALAPVKNKTSAIYCLSVMKTILDECITSSQPTPTDIWNHTDSSNSSQPNSVVRWKPTALAHLFQGSRGLKTLSLLSLQVIWACTSGMEISEPEATMASVVMANDILSAISTSEREEWCKQSGPVILRKLQERCLIPDLSLALRFQALTFLSSIDQEGSLSSEHVSAYENLVLDFEGSLSFDEQLEYAVMVSLPRFAPSFSSQYWQAFSEKVLDMLLEPKLPVLLRSAVSLSCLIDRLGDVLEQSSHCRQGLISALSNFRYLQKVERFLNGSPPIPAQTSAQGLHYCDKQVNLNISILSSSFCALLLRSALAALPEEARLPKRLVPGLLKRHASFDMSDSKYVSCDRKPNRNTRSALFIEVESTPETSHTSVHWKERLATQMQAKAKDQQQAIMDSFVEICRDLEARCEGVEAPLRQEQAKLADLHEHHDKLGQAYSALENQLMDRDLRINALEAECDSHGTQLEAASAESQDLLRRVEEATNELQKAHESARRTLAESVQERHELELEHATTVACKQEALDMTREELQQSHRDLQEVRSQCSRLEEAGRHTDGQQEILRSELVALRHEMRENQDRILRSEEERETLLEKHGDAQQELGKIREECAHYHQQNNNLRAELEDVKADTKQRIVRTTLAFEEATLKNRQEWLRIKANLEKELEQSRHELAQAEDSFREELAANRQKALDLRKRIDRLGKECQKKDAQIAEAQEMRNRLMTAMGIAGAGMVAAMPGTMQEPSTKSSTLPYRSASTIATPKPASQPKISTPADGYDEHGNDDEDEDSFASDVSSERGPTPKRARPRQSVDMRNTLHQQRQSMGSRSVKSVLRNRSAANRLPLHDLDANRSPMKAARSPSKVAFKNLQKGELGISTAERKDMEEWSFSNADILAGTPGIGLGTREYMDGLDEASTVDM